MKHRYLFLLVFITSVSLLLASLTSQEQVEKVRADDYSTYIHPGVSTTHITSHITCQIGRLPVLVFRFVFGNEINNNACLISCDVTSSFTSTIPIFLAFRAIVV